MSKKVLVLMGGFSAEREVSLVSGQGVADALKSKGYEVICHDLRDVRAFIRVWNRNIRTLFLTHCTETGAKTAKFRDCLICCKFLIRTRA